MSVIPKNIHWIWLGKKLPEGFITTIRLCQKLNPDYSFYCWSDNIQCFSGHLDLLNSFHSVSELINAVTAQADIDISRYASTFTRESHGCYANLPNASNLIRWLAIYIYGGVYLDVDIRVAKPFRQLFSPQGILFNIESFENNYFAADAAHPVFKEIITTCVDKYGAFAGWLMKSEGLQQK